MLQRVAKIISYALSNPVTGGVGGLVIMTRENIRFNDIAAITITVLFFYSILPFVSVYYLRLRGKADIFVGERTRRPRHFIPGLIGYALSICLFKAWCMSFLAVTSTSFLLTSLVLLILTLKTKVSIHVSGLATVGILVSYCQGILGAIFLLLLPALVWARVHTGEHTYPQTILGAIVGFAGTFLTLLVLKP